MSMREMKSSGVEWIGLMPKEWAVQKIKYEASLYGRIGWQGLTSEEYSDTGAYLITGVDFLNGTINWSNCVHVPEWRWEQAYQIRIQEGDLLITKDGTVGKVAIVKNLLGKATLNSGVLLIRKNETVELNYLYWSLVSLVFKNWFSIINAGNSTILHLYQNSFKNFSHPLPTKNEQLAIAKFLDSKCAEIDALTADIEKQIETLQEYKKSVITEAVTKGLDPNVKMKDSGVEWIGFMPCLWNIKRLKYICSISTGDSDTQDSIPDGQYPFYVRSPVVERSDHCSFDGEAILMAGDGAGAGRIFHYANGQMAIHQRVYCIHTIKEVIPRFLFFFMQSSFCNQMDKGSAQSTVPSVRLPMLKNFYIPIPPTLEQQQIIEFLDNRCSEIDTLISDKHTMLSSLAQFKQSLIYEYVTGKKTVPNA